MFYSIVSIRRITTIITCGFVVLIKLYLYVIEMQNERAGGVWAGWKFIQSLHDALFILTC